MQKENAMFSKGVQEVVDQVYKGARKNRLEFVSVDHLFYEMLADTKIKKLFKAFNIELAPVKRKVRAHIAKNELYVAKDSSRDFQLTPGFDRVMQQAIYLATTNGSAEVDLVMVLVAMMSEDCIAATVLKDKGISLYDVIGYMDSLQINGTGVQMMSDFPAIVMPMEQETSSDSLISKYTKNLNKMVISGEIDPIIGRSDEVNLLAITLCKRVKKNALLIGEPGVGKTAIAEGLAHWIVNQKVPQKLAKTEIYLLDMGAMLAGTKYRGDFEKRFKAVIAEFKKKPEAIIFIDEIHTLVGAGAASGGAIDAANLIKPELNRGCIRIIGATTYKEYRNVFENDSALSRRFEKIDVKESSSDETLKILKGLENQFEQHHQVEVSPEVYDTVVNLSNRYLHNRYQPDKAIDLLDEACAMRVSHTKAGQKVSIKPIDIQTAVAKMAQVPAHHITTSDKMLLKSLDSRLRKRIYGQDEAVSHLVEAIRLSRSGLKQANKPIGSFLFAGPTGVGKTELAIQLSQALGVNLARFDMSEYMERHDASQLVGASPGYVGFDQGGLMTEAVIKDPHSIILLDEIEKAHPDILNLLLQVMDYGFLTDNAGRKANFRDCIIIMTSNLGANAFKQVDLGFNNQSHASDLKQAVQHGLTPEFRNRLDAIIPFHQLDTKVMQKVVDHSLAELAQTLLEKSIKLNVSEKARAWLVKNGLDPELGARPLMRLVTNTLKKPLADYILFKHKGSVEIKVDHCVKKDALLLDYVKDRMDS